VTGVAAPAPPLSACQRVAAAKVRGNRWDRPALPSMTAPLMEGRAATLAIPLPPATAARDEIPTSGGVENPGGNNVP
jgi:hypothetical protein